MAWIGNASHFCGVSLIKSKCMLYDGMFSGTKRCKWVPDDYPFASHTICGGGYYVGQLWYRRFDSSMDAFELLRNRASPKRAMKAAKLGSKGQKKRKTSARYINGISIRAVMANGPLPKCLFCHGSIARGLVHTVNRVKLPDDRYKTNQHYHLGCCGEIHQFILFKSTYKIIYMHDFNTIFLMQNIKSIIPPKPST